VTAFDTVLVANRAEIALRVIRGVAAAGLRSVAVYSDADRDAPHVHAADTAVRIGPASAADSYLSIPALLDAAKRSQADAVHPGYGFLSERAEFARAVTEAGLVFIGPPAEVIAAMGRKDEAREVAVDAGVPVLPAVRLDSAAPDSALGDIGHQIGFPLLVKAASGGGGKGMRVVRAPAELADAVAAARREAQAAFGDDTMLLERYVEHGRHIEVQVLADEHGGVVHLFERDCSVQRRHQKVVEEAPASMISPSVREVVRSAAVALARRVGYTNAGTVEFLVSGEDAWFLEMNTRLQVEHPVTEQVTGLDLVRLQLDVAQGLPLPFRQEDLSLHGHSMEARVYAEDPFNGFLPQAGVAALVRWPTGARVDAALESGQAVGTSYDPLLGKVIVSGSTREAARLALVRALDDTAILGLTTNVGFLRALAGSAVYRDGDIDTAWLDSHPGQPSLPVPDVAWYHAAWAFVNAGLGGGVGPLSTPDGWRLAGGAAPIPVTLVLRGHHGDAGAGTRTLSVDPRRGVLTSDGRDVVASAIRRTGPEVVLEVDGQVETGHVLVRPNSVLVACHGQTYTFSRPDLFGPAAAADLHDGSISAPMPGTVLAVNVSPGSVVHEGETVVVLEAMKMELALKAPFAGTVASVATTAGQQVDLGTELLRVLREGSSGPLESEPLEPGALEPGAVESGPIEPGPVVSGRVGPEPTSGAGP
jgi:acetyl-CoA/propionyl-CoA carboxylase, biotin carboxylase, biotin carboxyl carrier protein